MKMPNGKYMLKVPYGKRAKLTFVDDVHKQLDPEMPVPGICTFDATVSSEEFWSCLDKLLDEDKDDE